MRDNKIKEKLQTLSALCTEYSHYLDQWKKVEVSYDKFTQEVSVTWYNEVEKEWPRGDVVVYRPYTRRVFGIEDIDHRITSYRNKINYAKQKINKQNQDDEKRK